MPYPRDGPQRPQFPVAGGARVWTTREPLRVCIQHSEGSMDGPLHRFALGLLWKVGTEGLTSLAALGIKRRQLQETPSMGLAGRESQSGM